MRSLCILLSLLSQISVARSFTDPLFERADLSQLERERGASSSDAALNVQIPFFILERYFLEGRIHAAETVRADLTARCTSLLADNFSSLQGAARAEAAYTCALFWVEELHHQSASHHATILENINKTIPIGDKAPPTQADRQYFQGRFACALPSMYAERRGAGLVALEFLKRSKPEVKSTDYWRAECFRALGDRRQANRILRRLAAETPPEPRSQTLIEDPYRKEQAVNDGLSHGWSPSLLFSPVSGVGAAIVFHDDRVGDEDRRLRAQLQVGLRRYFEGALAYEDATLIPDFRLRFDLDGLLRKLDFYGTGGDTEPSSRIEYGTQSVASGLAVERALTDTITFSLGWGARYVRMEEISFSSVYNVAELFHSGPEAGLRWDTRDSAVDPRDGARAEITGYFPVVTPARFERWGVSGEFHRKLWWDHTIHARAMGRFVTGTIPFVELSTLGGGWLPATRPSRFQDRHAVALSIAYGAKVWGPFRVIPFFNLGRVFSDWSDANPYAFGGGGALQVGASKFRGRSAKIEMGTFGGEFIVQGSAEAAW